MKTSLIKILLLFNMVLCLFLLSGCWDLREINASAIPVNAGIELGKDNIITFSTLFARTDSSSESGRMQIGNIVTMASDYSVSLAARRQMLSLSKVPEWSHIHGIILGENAARNGLPMITDFIMRNRNITPGTDLFIAAGSSPQDLLAHVYIADNDINKLVQVNELLMGGYVPITMGDFVYKLMTPGIEPAVPQLSLAEVPHMDEYGALEVKHPEKPDNSLKKIILNGTAVFKGDKMVGTLNKDESKGYRWLNPSVKTGGFLTIASPSYPGEYINLEIESFRCKTIPRISNNQINMHLDIEVHINFYETTRPEPVVVREIERAANIEIARQIRSCINKSQSLNSDISGWGRILESKHPEQWHNLKSNWDNIYPFIKADIKVNTAINHSYLSKKAVKLR